MYLRLSVCCLLSFEFEMEKNMCSVQHAAEEK